MTVETYPEMNAKIVDILQRDKDNPLLFYAAQRIEELEAEVERLQRWVLIHKARRDQNYESAKKFKKERDEAHAKIDRLGRELHDEQVRRNKWERICEELGLIEPEPDACLPEHRQALPREAMRGGSKAQ